MKKEDSSELIKVDFSEDDNYEKEEKNYFKIDILERVHKTGGVGEFFRIVKAVILGTGIEKSIGDVGLIRKLAALLYIALSLKPKLFTSSNLAFCSSVSK